jgi:hypothetical protein
MLKAKHLEESRTQLKMAVFWIAAPCSLEEACSSETSVNQTTRRNNPEDSHLHPRCRENMKSHYSSILLSSYSKYK